MTGWRGWAGDCADATRDVIVSFSPYQWILITGFVAAGGLITIKYGEKGAQFAVGMLLMVGLGAAMLRADYQDSVIEIQRTKIAELSAVKEES